LALVPLDHYWPQILRHCLQNDQYSSFYAAMVKKRDDGSSGVTSWETAKQILYGLYGKPSTASNHAQALNRARIQSSERIIMYLDRFERLARKAERADDPTLAMQFIDSLREGNYSLFVRFCQHFELQQKVSMLSIREFGQTLMSNPFYLTLYHPERQASIPSNCQIR
jgi:hypothetical protein